MPISRKLDKKPVLKHVMAVFAVDGTDFYGVQSQPGLRTVEGVLKAALSRLGVSNKKIRYSSRLDRGVHSQYLICDFFLPSGLDTSKAKAVLNRLLPDDMAARKVKCVSEEFNARYAAKRKKYVYSIAIGDKPSPFESRYLYWTDFDLDIGRMKRIAKLIPGRRDFSCFISSGSSRLASVTTIDTVLIKKSLNARLTIEITGKAFFYRMVRNIAGFLYAVACGRYTDKEIARILGGDASTLRLTLPAKGLCLTKTYL